MDKRKQFATLFLALSMVLLLACAPQAAPAPASQAPAPAPAAAPVAAPVPAATAKPAWETKWEKTLAAAKVESTVTLFTSGGAGVRLPLTKGVKEAYGITAEVLSGRAQEFLTKAFAERRAGLYNYDLYVGGFTTMLTQAKPAGLLQSIEPALILPDVTDPERIKKVWSKGQLPWVDRDHTVFATTLTVQTPIVVNSDLVKEGEIKSFRDLLNPKWKGKLILGDPTVAGSGQLGIAAIDGIMGWDYVKEMAKMELLVLTDQYQQLEWVARGKASILICPQPDRFREFLRLGVPIKGVVPVEGTWVSAGSSGISFIAQEPHPNAARVFINWLTSKEGQEFFAPAVGFHSAREDVRTDYLRPEDIRREGVKYFNAYTEEFNAGDRRLEVNKLAKELFGPMAR